MVPSERQSTEELDGTVPVMLEVARCPGVCIERWLSLKTNIPLVLSQESVLPNLTISAAVADGFNGD